MLRIILSPILFLFSTPLFSQITFATNPAAAGQTGQVAAGALNDSWESAQQSIYCGADLFIPVYGTLSDNCSGGAPVGPGSITGLVQSNNINYPGTLTFEERLINENESDLATKGTPYTNACGATGGVRDDSNNTMQGNAPSANGLGMIDSDTDGNLDYYNGYASPSSGKKVALLFSFSVPVTQFGLFLGDTESRSDGLDGYAGKVVVFNGGTLQMQADIPTGTANQSNCDGDNNSSFDGCGNDESVWVAYSGAPVDEVLLVVGEVVSDSGPNNNKLSFSGITLGGSCMIIAPVELSRFEVQSIGRQSLLNWTTLNEHQNDYFEIQYCLDGVNFQTLAKVDGQGDSFTSTDYQYIHQNPSAGINYYRLKQVDLDGRFEYSDIQAISHFDAKSRVTISPNPGRDFISIKLDDHLGQSGHFTLLNMYGQIVFQDHFIFGESQINVQELVAGHYQIVIQYENKHFTERFLRL